MPTAALRPPEMTPATREILARVRQMIPPLLGRFHKGQLGRIGVIGGSEDYTGAPYFSAMASARLGCDLSHVICTPAAATVIKTYSPNLMVHPWMRSADGGDTDAESAGAAVAGRIIEQLLPRLHVLVVGPGLGRDSLMQATVARVMEAARKAEMPLVVDADALWLVQQRPQLVAGYGLAVLTPNVVEFGRLEKAVLPASEQREAGTNKTEAAEAAAEGRCLRLSRALGGVTIVQKGPADVIASSSSSSGITTLVSDLEGSHKRSGGQGDTLTGAIATFLGWRKAYLDGLWEHSHKAGSSSIKAEETVALAAFGGSCVTRECSRLAYARHGRSMQASDLTEEVHGAFINLFGPEDEEEARL